MDWNAIAAIGELVGAAAVVVSLLYVGRELKHSSTVARVQGIQSTNEKLFDWALAIASDPELAGLMARVENTECTPKDFSPRDATRVGFLYHALLSLTHTLFERRAEGLITEQELDRWAAKNRGVMGAPYLCSLWHGLRPNFPDEYTTWLERRYNLPSAPEDGS